MKLKLLKGLTLVSALTLVGTAAVPVHATNINGNEIDEETLDDDELVMNEDCGSTELDADPADIDNVVESSDEVPKEFYEILDEVPEEFYETFGALTWESAPANSVHGDYLLQSDSDLDNDVSVSEGNEEEVFSQSEIDEILKNMEEVGTYSEDLGDGLVMEVTEYVKEHPSSNRTNVNKVEYTLSYKFKSGSTVHIQYILRGLFKYNGRTSSCVNAINYYYRSTNTYNVSYSARRSGNSAYGMCTLKNPKTGKVASHKNFRLWVTANGKVNQKAY